MRSKAGFSLLEIIIALAVSLVVLVAFLTVFSNSNRVAVASRHRSVAIVIAQGMMDDIEAHTYGNPAPANWSQSQEEPVYVWVGDRQQKMAFEKTVSFQNGSFVGDSTESSDLVTLVVSWREGVGDTQTDQALTAHNKKLEVQVPVWR